ncbi:unnamed protein product [Staurois parvus]|uniref:Uncharacterized protein n=1 Tax=Staurois parvus TaxID=386267 RepID=A0ABN9ASC4_9NEOB|nr:unnamed protein product [Staurois parvus]
MRLCRAITIIRIRALARNSPMVVVTEMQIILKLRKPARRSAKQVFVQCIILCGSILIH